MSVVIGAKLNTPAEDAIIPIVATKKATALPIWRIKKAGQKWPAFGVYAFQRDTITPIGRVPVREPCGASGWGSGRWPVGNDW
jgi:hypothetical protein